MSQSLLQLAIDQGTCYEVAMNEVKFIRFGDNKITSIGTANLNGCSTVMVLSRYAAILGHIAPRPDNAGNNLTAGDQHAQSKMDLLSHLYMSNRQYFPTGSNGWVVCAMFGGDIGLPDQQRIFGNALARLGLTYSLGTYEALAQNKWAPTWPGKGTVLIQGGGTIPTVYIEDMPVTGRDSGQIASASTTTTETLSTPPYASGSTTVGAGSSTHASQSTTGASSSNTQYYYVIDGVYYYYSGGESVRVSEQPMNAWVLNQNGWLGTNSTKKWRYWNGTTLSYR